MVQKMTKMLKLAVCIIFLNGCYYDAENELYPAANCSVIGSYSSEVLPLINSKCISCHSNTSPSGGIDLSTYDKVKNQSALILQTIKHTGNSNMPKGEPQLPKCDIQKFSKWIEIGMPNN